jgi:hypothetical protein
MKYEVTYEAYLPGTHPRDIEHKTLSCEADNRGQALNLVEKKLQDKGFITRLPVSIHELDDSTPII